MQESSAAECTCAKGVTMPLIQMHQLRTYRLRTYPIAAPVSPRYCKLVSFLAQEQHRIACLCSHGHAQPA